MSEEKALIIKEEINVLEVFTGDSYNDILKGIREKALISDPDVSTSKGRKIIISSAAKVASSKVLLDNLGKELVADWKKKAGQVDASRKVIKDNLEALKLEIRQPVTDWEKENAEKIEAEKLAKEILEDHEKALEENQLIDDRKAIELEKKRLADLEIERVKKEEESKLEEERKKEEDLRIKKAVEDERKKEASRIEKEKVAVLQREAKAKEDLRRAREDKEKAEKQAKIDKEDAEKKAKIDQENAVKAEREKAELEAKQKEDDRIKAEKEADRQAELIRLENEKKSADKEHRRVINNGILTGFSEQGFNEEDSKKLIVAIINGKINHLTINY